MTESRWISNVKRQSVSSLAPDSAGYCHSRTRYHLHDQATRPWGSRQRQWDLNIVLLPLLDQFVHGDVPLGRGALAAALWLPGWDCCNGQQGGHGGWESIWVVALRGTGRPATVLSLHTNCLDGRRPRGRTWRYDDRARVLEHGVGGLSRYSCRTCEIRGAWCKRVSLSSYVGLTSCAHLLTRSAAR